MKILQAPIKIEKTTGKPYSQQLGRKHGKGTGKIGDKIKLTKEMRNVLFEAMNTQGVYFPFSTAGEEATKMYKNKHNICFKLEQLGLLQQLKTSLFQGQQYKITKMGKEFLREVKK